LGGWREVATALASEIGRQADESRCDGRPRGWSAIAFRPNLERLSRPAEGTGAAGSQPTESRFYADLPVMPTWRPGGRAFLGFVMKWSA